MCNAWGFDEFPIGTRPASKFETPSFRSPFNFRISFLVVQYFRSVGIVVQLRPSQKRVERILSTFNYFRGVFDATCLANRFGHRPLKKRTEKRDGDQNRQPTIVLEFLRRKKLVTQSNARTFFSLLFFKAFTSYSFIFIYFIFDISRRNLFLVYVKYTIRNLWNLLKRFF